MLTDAVQLLIGINSRCGGKTLLNTNDGFQTVSKALMSLTCFVLFYALPHAIRVDC